MTFVTVPRCETFMNLIRMSNYFKWKKTRDGEYELCFNNTVVERARKIYISMSGESSNVLIKKITVIFIKVNIAFI